MPDLALRSESQRGQQGYFQFAVLNIAQFVNQHRLKLDATQSTLLEMEISPVFERDLFVTACAFSPPYPTNLLVLFGDCKGYTQASLLYLLARSWIWVESLLASKSVLTLSKLVFKYLVFSVYSLDQKVNISL